MVINIRDSERLYGDWIQEVKKFEKSLLEKGFLIEKKNEFELGGEWVIVGDEGTVGEFVWNVPSILALTVDGKEVVDEDYLKGITMWREVIDDCKKLIFKSSK